LIVNIRDFLVFQWIYIYLASPQYRVHHSVNRHWVLQFRNVTGRRCCSYIAYQMT